MELAKPKEKLDGLGKVEIKGNKVRITLRAKTDKEGKILREQKQFLLNKEDCPDYIQVGVFFVSLNNDGTKMYSMRPQNGVFEAKFKEFAAQKDKEPTPKLKPGQFGPYLQFTALCEIVSGQYKGMIVPGTLNYNFEGVEKEVNGEKKLMTEITHPKGKPTAKLVEFLTVVNLMKQTIPFKENLLPSFQKWILRQDPEPKFSINVKTGYIDSFYQDAAVSAEDFG